MKGLVMIIVARSTSVPKGDKHPTITTKTPPPYLVCNVVCSAGGTHNENERDVDKTTAEATTNNN